MLGVGSGGRCPHPAWSGGSQHFPIIYPPEPGESDQPGRAVPGSLTQNYKHCVKHKPSAARSRRRGQGPTDPPGLGLTLDTDNDPDHSDHTTYFSLAWPSEGAPPDLLLYIVAGCSGFVSAVIRAVCVVTRVSPASASDGDGPAWVTGNIVTLSPLPPAPAPASLPASLCSQPRRPLTARLPHTQLTCQANLTQLSCSSNDQLFSLISLACPHHPCLQ